MKIIKRLVGQLDLTANLHSDFVYKKGLLFWNNSHNHKLISLLCTVNSFLNWLSPWPWAKRRQDHVCTGQLFQVYCDNFGVGLNLDRTS
jgi:hypothetical protein